MSYIGFIPKTILQNLDLGQVFNQNPVLKLLHQQPKGITMKQLTFTILATYSNKESANKAAKDKGLTPYEAVFHCENGMYGYEIRIYDNWQEWQPDLYLNN